MPRQMTRIGLNRLVFKSRAETRKLFLAMHNPHQNILHFQLVAKVVMELELLARRFVFIRPQELEQRPYLLALKNLKLSFLFAKESFRNMDLQDFLMTPREIELYQNSKKAFKQLGKYFINRTDWHYVALLAQAHNIDTHVQLAPEAQDAPMVDQVDELTYEGAEDTTLEPESSSDDE